MEDNLNLTNPDGSSGVLILLTNDDGIYAPGLAALERELCRLGEVRVVAPAKEQSGVGHSITYLTPLIAKEVFNGEQQWGWAVEGSPADCVKLGITQFCPRRPDLVVSGINSGLNAGINVLTRTGGRAKAFFGDEFPVSLEFHEHARFDEAARIARSLIEQVLKKRGTEPQLYNINIPKAALDGTPEVRVVPMDVTQYGERFEKRLDPWGRAYYWATGTPPPGLVGQETDLSALGKGFVTLTPLDFNLTKESVLAQMRPWQFRLENHKETAESPEKPSSWRPTISSMRKQQQVIDNRNRKNQRASHMDDVDVLCAVVRGCTAQRSFNQPSVSPAEW